MNIKDFKDELFALAKKEGFSEYELYYSRGKGLKISVFKGEIEKFDNAESGGVSFRGIFNGAIGYAYSEKIDQNIIPILLKYAKENANISRQEEVEEIFSGSNKYQKVQTYYDDLEKIEVDQIISKCFEIEKAVLEYSPQISGCNYCSVGKSFSEVYIANSKGLELNKKGNHIFAYTSALAKDGNEIKSGMEVFAGFDLNEFNPTELGRKASQKAIANLGASSIKSGKYSVVFENKCFTELFSCFFSSFYAENVQKGFSLLKGKLEEKVFSDLVTILEDPLMIKGYNSTPFDSEGVACFNKTVVENGVLKTYLYNLKTAKKDGVKSTGNGFKSGFKGNISTSVTNFYIKNGETSFNQMIKNVYNGVYITELAGLHAGVNGISGDFSLLASGFLIQNGKITNPIEQITIAGNYFQMMKNIEQLADDLEFSTDGVGSPSIFVGKMDISGE